MLRRKPKTVPNIVGMGTDFVPGGFYGATWYYEGEFVMNELLHIPVSERNPRRYVEKWVRELTNYLTLPVVDIHIKQMELK